MLAVDAAGEAVDGDQILAICALALDPELVVVTTMTNLGFHRLMDAHGIRVVTTDVGDRYVLEALRAEGGTLGGEQSGHVIVLDAWERLRFGRDGWLTVIPEQCPRNASGPGMWLYSSRKWCCGHHTYLKALRSAAWAISTLRMMRLCSASGSTARSACGTNSWAKTPNSISSPLG